MSKKYTIQLCQELADIASKKTFGELYNKTIEREMLIKNVGYKAISIWESDFKKVINA